LVPLAFGTQTGGSMIRPASFCGVAAVKPSFRTLPMVGVKSFSWTLDTAGLFAATVADAAFALAACTGRRELLPGTGEPAAPRIGVVRQDFADAADPAADEALEGAARAAERAGARVEAAGLPDAFAEAFHAHAPLQDFEAAQALAWEYDSHRDALPPRLAALLDAAQAITPEAYDDARRKAHRARAALREAFGAHDVLLTYAAPGAAPEGYASTGDARFNRLWTLLGVPCVNVPGLTDGKGRPVGVQVIAPFGRDARALEAARFVEAAIAKFR
jgi:Asp-tRNA(Asn)/Glu-tRNA(Gln) amidotransferase A subunit family amidase